MPSSRLAYVLLAGMAAGALWPASAHAYTSPQRLVVIITPPSDVTMPLQVQPPEPPPPDEPTPTDPPVQLQETPEPAAMVTGLVGAGLLVWYRSRRKKEDGPEDAPTSPGPR